MKVRNTLVFALPSVLMALTIPAGAQDVSVTERLSTHGGLSGTNAKKLASKVTQHMSRAADTLAAPNDPLRMAMSLALLQTPTPADNMAAAKVRLRLYAGLNEWALEALFPPKPGVIAGCTRDYGLTQPECEALVAAAGKISLAEARTAAAGQPTAFAMNSRPAAAQPPAGRFGRYDSGYRGSSGAAPVQPVAAAQTTATPVAAASTSAVSQKEAYRLQREAYLARQKAQFDARKQATGGSPAAASEPAPAATAAKAPAPASAEPATAAPAAETVAEAGAADKATLDNDFLNGLLSDPLGGS